MAAISFDLWDTLVVDDSDESDRAAAGLLPKVEARREAFVAEVLAHHPEVPRSAAAAGWDAAVARFRIQWRLHHLTPHLRAQVADAYAQLGLEPTPGAQELVERIASLEVDHPPHVVPGAAECLSRRAKRYPLAILSDSITTPGTHLRRILAHHGLLGFFNHCVFSDEVGAAKPSRIGFEAAAQALGVSAPELLHVGDREANDVDGVHAVGGKAVLFTGAVDRGSERTTAEIVCRDLQELPELVAGFEARA